MSNFDNDFKLGTEYEKWISGYLSGRYRMCIGHNDTAELQKEFNCDTPTGIEIKYDRRLSETGNVYLEVTNRNNKPSNIFREPFPPYFLTGNYSEFWFFDADLLRENYNSFLKCDNGRAMEYTTGRLLNRTAREEYCICGWTKQGDDYLTQINNLESFNRLFIKRELKWLK